MSAADWLPELGQYGGSVVAGGLAMRYASEAWRNWRKGRRDGSEATMSDAATTNAMLLAALREERTDNRSKDERIDGLEAELEVMRQAIFDQRREYEEQLADLRSKLAAASLQLSEVTRQLDGLQQRLQADKSVEEH